jgi:hypothetical protein
MVATPVLMVLHVIHVKYLLILPDYQLLKTVSVLMLSMIMELMINVRFVKELVLLALMG